jgi:hypothetical protein
MGVKIVNPSISGSGGGGSLHAEATTLVAGFMSASDKTKLDAITGTNTGDQTTITGNAGTATALQTARTINGVSFDGTANITVTAAAGTLTGTTLNSTVVSSSLTSVGTISSGTWNGSTIDIAHGGTGQTTQNAALNALLPSQTGNSGKFLTSNGTDASWATAGTGTVTSVDVSGGTTGLTTSGGPVTASGTITLSGTLVAANGGTGQSSYTIGDILYASTTSALSKLAAVAAGSYLRSAGTGTAPVWSTTTLPNSATTGDLLYASASNTYSNLAGVATGNALISGGVGTAPSWGKIGLTTHVSGTLPIANGGTDLATTPTNGQLLIGNGTNYTLATITDGYGHSTTNGSGTITAAVSLVSSETSSTTTNTTASTTDALLTNSISGTPAAGTWLVMFTCSMGLNSTTGAQTFISLYKGASGSTTKVSGTERRVQNGSGGQGASVVHSASFQTIQTFNGTDIYEIRWRVSGGTSSIFSRAISLLRIA